ncbi:hypothetical protein EC968_008099 [Mortierella alpina]|nr:hypothetical protein EC968_008099 [Mortierella alpina]
MKGHTIAVSTESKAIYFWSPAPEAKFGFYKYGNGNFTFEPIPAGATQFQHTEANITIEGEARAVFDIVHHHLDVLCGSLSRKRMISMQPKDGTSLALFGLKVTGNNADSLEITKGYAAVWSTLKNVIMTYGGTTPDQQIYNTNVMEYVRITTDKAYDTKWEIPRTLQSGETPGEIAYHCMVPAYKGKKMVVFGGRRRDGSVSGGVYFLDVLEMKWSKGPDADPSQRRYGMACTVAGDNLVIWGGQDANGLPMKDEMIIYNMLFNVWTKEFRLPVAPPNITNYVPPPKPTVTETSTPTATATATATSKSGVNAKAAKIGGGVAGGPLPPSVSTPPASSRKV